MRLFVACELPPATKTALADVQSRLRSRGAQELRWVRPEGMHLTLKFLGEVPAERVPAIEEALAGAVEGPLELRLAFSALGSFGGPTRLRVVWVGAEGDVPRLVDLAGRVDAALTTLGFPRERRPYSPHLTLARVSDRASPEQRRRLSELIAGFPMPSVPEAVVREVSLMRSFLEPGGARYQRLAAFPRPRT
jgi:2'-5' RNA ligase